MRNNLTPFKLNIWHKLTLTHALVTLATIFLAEITGLSALVVLKGGLAWGVHAVLVISVATVGGLLLGILISRPFARRVRQILEVSQAWLRGNLAVRIPDLRSDDLGLLANRLNLLAEQLAEDEQDLDVLRERNTRLTDQVRALAVVEERNRLARELHDSVKQHLFSLAMTASAVRTYLDAQGDATQPEAVDLAEMVREIEVAAQTAQRETTRLIEDLRPGSLQEQGLAAALNDYTLLFGAQEHILVYLDVQGDDKRLPPSVVEALYRVAQEALHNVARHAKATRVDVDLRTTSERVAMTIEDNGVGFDMRQASPGLGLTNMQERLMAVGGRLTLDSQVGIGTTVLAEIELPHALNMPLGPAGTGTYRPNLSPENWAWLGAKLVIPVGQTWPWLPADREHLRKPQIEPGIHPLKCRKVPALLGLSRAYTITNGQNTPIVRIHRGASGSEWEAEDASWALRAIRGLSGRMVLVRNNQPLAAIQYQGRQMHTWSEIIYDGRGYGLIYVKGSTPEKSCTYALVDEFGEQLLCFESGNPYHIRLTREMPLPLLAMTIARILGELSAAVSD